MEQSQFLDVIDRDEAERRFHAALDLAPLDLETVALDEALGRVLAEDLQSNLDVPGFTRSNVDGFAVRAADTFGCDEETSRELELNEENLATGLLPTVTIEPGTATPIATGGVLPRGGDAVVIVEHTRLDTDQVHDANATVLADAVRELGCEARPMGIIPDDEARVEAALHRGLAEADVVLLSGGTSKGAGDVDARVVTRLESPGILA